MRKVDTWLESTREYTLKRQRKFPIIVCHNKKTKGKEPGRICHTTDTKIVTLFDPSWFKLYKPLVNSSRQLLMQVCG